MYTLKLASRLFTQPPPVVHGATSGGWPGAVRILKPNPYWEAETVRVAWSTGALAATSDHPPAVQDGATQPTTQPSVSRERPYTLVRSMLASDSG